MYVVNTVRLKHGVYGSVHTPPKGDPDPGPDDTIPGGDTLPGGEDTLPGGEGT